MLFGPQVLAASFALPFLALSSMPGQPVPAAASAELARGFASPPADARPMVRWWWFGAAVQKPEILRELEQMKADGIGGAELAFVYPEVVDDPARGLKNLPFLSPAMLDAVKYAQAEGRRLGLRIDVTLCSGWPYGGPATTLAEAAGRLRTMEVAVAPGSASIALPPAAEGDTLIAAALVNGAPKHWDAEGAVPLAIAAGAQAIAMPKAQTARVALLFYASHTRQQVKRAAVGAEGFVLDPFSRAAVATHLRAVGEPLVQAFGATPPYAIFSDSLEAYGADWTPALPEEFKRRRGYDLLPHLPELVAGGTPAAERVRHDYGRTLTELVDQNYLTQINDWATAHHTRFRSQTYGEPAVSLASQRLVALPEGEGPQWRAFSTLRWATSGNHLFGNNVTSGETFTWLHSPVFRATPLDMKAEADIDSIMGENQLIFHGWPYSAPQAGEPGWSLYAAGAFNDHNPWHPVMPSVTAYIARMSYLLRQGKPANQVAILLPTDDAWAGFTPAHVTVTGAMQKLVTPKLVGAILSAGYNLDFTDADTIDRLGIQHQILLLPPTDRIPLTTLAKIRAWEAQGGKVLCVGRAPSEDAEGQPLAPEQKLSASHVVASESDLGEALHSAAVPDFQLAGPDGRDQLGFIRRRLPGADLYFVVNTGNQPVHNTVALGTENGLGYGLSTETGAPMNPHQYASRIQLDLAPYESRVYVFDHHGLSAVPEARVLPDRPLLDLSADWKVTFTGTGRTTQEAALADWTADPATLHYSGEAVYTRDFMLPASSRSAVYLEIPGGAPLPGAPNSPPEHEALGKDGLPNPLVTRTGPGMHAYFDPPVREAALVTINGKPAGALWHPPYRLDVTKLLHAGQNHIEIRVYNTALNAWSAQPPHDFKPLIAKYGDRFQMQDLDKVRPIASGILGKIVLTTEGARK